MIKYLLLFFPILSCNSQHIQQHKTNDVISKAEYYLKEVVGDSLFKYFQLDSNSYYEYFENGKTNWETLKRDTVTRGIFINGDDIRFTLKHPQLEYVSASMQVYVELDSNLNLSKEIWLGKIPPFLLNSSLKPWLTKNEIDHIINGLKLKPSKYPISSNLSFDQDKKIFCWQVINYMHKEKCYSEVELLVIEPTSGKVMSREETTLSVLHCY